MTSTVSRTLRWGILGTAKVARNRLIPAFAGAPRCELVAIASRDRGRATKLADLHRVPHAYGSYEALLADASIDAIYLPLPNGLHAAWTNAALRSGKHVLCEKPLACSAEEARLPMELSRQTGCHLQEAFSFFAHPQWQVVRTILDSGRLGELRSVHGHFSFHTVDPSDIRNRADLGGGGLLDLGCYGVAILCWIMGRAPERVMATMQHDARFGVDVAGTAILDFGGVHATFVYATQSAYRQQLDILGTAARLEVPLPFTPPADRECLLRIFDSREFGRGLVEQIRIAPCNQFAATLNSFAAYVLDGTPPPPISLEHTLANLRTMDAIRRSAATGRAEASC
jgi:predicted dehydrogenase